MGQERCESRPRYDPRHSLRWAQHHRLPSLHRCTSWGRPHPKIDQQRHRIAAGFIGSHDRMHRVPGSRGNCHVIFSGRQRCEFERAQIVRCRAVDRCDSPKSHFLVLAIQRHLGLAAPDLPPRRSLFLQCSPSASTAIPIAWCRTLFPSRWRWRTVHVVVRPIQKASFGAHQRIFARRNAVEFKSPTLVGNHPQHVRAIPRIGDGHASLGSGAPVTELTTVPAIFVTAALASGSCELPWNLASANNAKL